MGIQNSSSVFLFTKKNSKYLIIAKGYRGYCKRRIISNEKAMSLKIPYYLSGLETIFNQFIPSSPLSVNLDQAIEKARIESKPMIMAKAEVDF